MHEKNDRKKNKQVKAKHFLLFVFPQINECSIETGMEEEMQRNRKDSRDEAKREREENNGSISSCSVCV